MSAAGPILEIKDLKVSFLDPMDFSKEIAAVDRVNLSAAEGSFTSIVGESGSGKSVTALSICRLVDPYRISGNIFWHSDGRKLDLLRCPARELLRVRGREISYIFQDPASSLNPVLRIGPQIEETRRAHFNESGHEARRMTLDLLERLRFRDPERVRCSFPHELSGGMQQRAMIAISLAAGPKLLVADEPTTALDVTVESEILKLLKEIQAERRLTVLFITHDLRLAVGLSDVIHVMQKGRCVERLDRSSGFAAAQEYSKKLFAARRALDKPKSPVEI